MADLLLGPMLRYISETEATVWVETDAASEVEVLGQTATTFPIDGHHYALVELTGLEPGRTYEYDVKLDGKPVWPLPESDLPPSVIRTIPAHGEIRLLYGSCRVSLPHEPPYSLSEPEHEQAHGIDALRTKAIELSRGQPSDLPHSLLMLGDQIYADDLSPHMERVTESRARPEGAPKGELADFEEYTLAYREAWSEPLIRWLFSTVPTAMVFDDHEIHSEWKISRTWLREMRSKGWFDRRIADGLTAYWVYQHLGNLPISELRDNELLREVRESDDGGPAMRRVMCTANDQPGHSRWSFCRDLGRSRLLVIDSRAGRELDPGNRRIIDSGEWDWIRHKAEGDFDHLLLASSVPFFLPAGLHHAEGWVEAIGDGAWGRLGSKVGEAIRLNAVTDHWACFRRSFDQLVELIDDASSGRLGKRPASVVMLSGDVHHCYVGEVGFRPDEGRQDGRAKVWQCVCSAYRKRLTRRDAVTMRLANSRAAARLGAALARWAGVVEPGVAFRLTDSPTFENQIGTLFLGDGRAKARIETTAGSHWSDPELTEVFAERLLS